MSSTRDCRAKAVALLSVVAVTDHSQVSKAASRRRVAQSVGCCLCGSGVGPGEGVCVRGGGGGGESV